jgi:hypothetical protein
VTFESGGDYLPEEEEVMASVERVLQPPDRGDVPLDFIQSDFVIRKPCLARSISSWPIRPRLTGSFESRWYPKRPSGAVL